MAKKQTRRLQPRIVKQDKQCLSAIKGLTDYKPADSKFAKTALQSAADDVDDTQEKEKQTEVAAKAARAAAVKAEWTLHNLILGSKTQVKAQYGDDSDEVNAVGLKKKSEYKDPTRKKTTQSLKAA
jgi:hypothetical protein